MCAPKQFLYPDVGAGITRTLQIGTVAPAAMLLPLPHKEPIVDMDPNNPVVKMCVQGMQAESEGRHDDARRLFEQAWAERSDDYEACIAAHYLARHQERPQDVLRWNQTALDHAKLVDDERVHGFYPSLYLNLGHAYEQTGHRDKAARYYQLGAERVQELPEGPYGDMVRSAIARGQQRISEVDQ
jgi:tetratricopeptide (TPR) repeat protein